MGRPAAKKTSATVAKTASKTKATRAAEPTGSCFMISPFGGYFDLYWEALLQPAITDAGLKPTRADDPLVSSNVIDDIWRLINEASVVLADLTNKNPNVFYELGLAHAARKPVMLITQTMDDVPFDLQSRRCYVYDVRMPKWPDDLMNRITEGLRETLAAPESQILPTFLLTTPGETHTITAGEKLVLELQQQVSSLANEMRSVRQSLGGPLTAHSLSATFNPEVSSLPWRVVSSEGAPHFKLSDLIGPTARSGFIERAPAPPQSDTPAG